mmetsp:Transcript_104560/g.327078  ORF Transcript_104560/g.327078 Transcript_104560/m.327078 type:complete len:394 (+) Transcript_104560:111-1292(+)
MATRSQCPRVLRLALLGVAAAAATSAATVEGQCDAAGGSGCQGLPAEQEPSSVAAPTPSLSAEPGGAVPKEAVVREELGALRLGFVLSLLGGVTLWIAATIKFAVDGSLPARLALWGLLPEAYAAISVRAVVALLRLKTGTTPVVVLRSCVTDAGAAELAEALQKYGQKAGLEALELPHNPALGEAGLRHLASAACVEGSPLRELDISYNPQLRDSAVGLLLPLLEPKASKVSTLRLADCSLTIDFLKRLADSAAKSSLRELDLSYNALGGGGEALAALCEAPVLEELTLTCCGLRLEDVKALAEQLPYTSIRTLQLGGNALGNEGLLALTEHLPASQVDDLGLEGNGIEASSLTALGEAWVKRPFSCFRLHGNRMSRAEVTSFVQTLRSIHG